MEINIPEKEENINLTYINNEYTPHMQQTKLDTTTIELATPSNICVEVTPSEKNCFKHENTDGAVTNNKKNLNKNKEKERKDSGCGSLVGARETQSTSKSVKHGNSKLYKKEQEHNCNRKNKRKRRRGKQKTNSKSFKKDNWKFQMPQRYRSNSNSTNMANMTNILLEQIERQRSIVPYNTNKFLMEEHLAEVPNALLTPNGRTRDSSFSIDSEDNYFYSLPEDEEEFLTKEFSNVYERARVERFECMTKQQLIDECLLMENRCSQIDSKQHQKYCADFITKIKFLEEKVQCLGRENIELRRLLEQKKKINCTAKLSHKTKKTGNKICSSEDSESDSSSSNSVSCSSSCSSSSISEYSAVHSPQNMNNSNENNIPDSILMETDEVVNNLPVSVRQSSENINLTEQQLRRSSELVAGEQLSVQNNEQNQSSINVNGINSYNERLHNNIDLNHNESNNTEN